MKPDWETRGPDARDALPRRLSVPHAFAVLAIEQETSRLRAEGIPICHERSGITGAYPLLHSWGNSPRQTWSGACAPATIVVETPPSLQRTPALPK
jgi:hypothetical protein